jgi:hypothetical protein
MTFLIQKDYNYVSITMYLYLFEDASEDEFQLLSFIWMFKVLMERKVGGSG